MAKKPALWWGRRSCWGCWGWRNSGYRLIDRERAAELLGLEGPESLRAWQRQAAAETQGPARERRAKWSESIAVGSQSFVQEAQRRLGVCGRRREVKAEGQSFVLRESPGRYESGSGASAGGRERGPAPNAIVLAPL